MTPEECVLPVVAESLAPFIKPREEVIRIRQALHSHVQRYVQPHDGPLTVANLSRPPSTQRQETLDGALSGVRRAYMKALQAHSAARVNYDALKADITRLFSESGEKTQNQPDRLVNECYIPLLRQRERLRKLRILDRAFSQVTALGKGTADVHLDDIVKQSAGDPPTPPANPNTAFNDRPDVETLILQLKKAVLSAKQSVDGHNVSTTWASAKSPIKPGGQAEIAGLQSALNELTVWMEQQLAVIGEGGGGEEESTSIPPTPRTISSASECDRANLEDIEALYEQYLSTRLHLIETVNEPPDSGPPPLSPVHKRIPSIVSEKSTPAETLLPYISTLTSVKQQESALLQQTVHLRRAISTADGETRRLISRLADESHLVQPGASKGKDWSVAAAEASLSTAEFVSRKVMDGEEHTSKAEKLLDDIERLSYSADKLIELC